MKIGEKIKEIRQSRLMSQEVLAKETGLTIAALSRIENGHVKKPNNATLRVISDALGVKVSELEKE